MNQHAFKGPVKLGSVTEYIKQARNKYDKAVQLGSTTTLQQYFNEFVLKGEMRDYAAEG